MCNPHLVVWTCITYALSIGYTCSCAAGYHNLCACGVLCAGLVASLVFQSMTDCDPTYLKIGAGIAASMMFAACATVTHACKKS